MCRDCTRTREEYEVMIMTMMTMTRVPEEHEGGVRDDDDDVSCTAGARGTCARN